MNKRYMILLNTGLLVILSLSRCLSSTPVPMPDAQESSLPSQNQAVQNLLPIP